MTKWQVVACSLAICLTSPAAAQGLPEWDINGLCAKDSAKNACIGAELEARRVASDRWLKMKDGARKTCLESGGTTPDGSYRKLAECAEAQLAAAAEEAKQKAEAAAKKAAEEAAAKKAADEAAKKVAEEAAAKKTAEEAEAKRKADEEAAKAAAQPPAAPAEPPKPQ